MQSISAGFDGAMDPAKSYFAALIEPLKSFFDIFSMFWVGVLLISAVFLIMLIIALIGYGSEFTGIIKKTNTIAVCAMLIAINAVLGLYTPVLSSYLKIEFGFITMPVASMLFGPVMGCIVGMIQDIVGLIMKPTGGLLFTLTLTDGITGMIYAAFLYKKPLKLARVFAAQLIIVTAVNMLLNSIALAPTVGSGLIGILPSRVIKNIILLPIQTAIAYAILKAVDIRAKTRLKTAD